MEWVGPLQLDSHLVQRGTKRLWVELRKFSNANLCKLSDSSLNIYGVVKMWYLFSFSFFYFYIYIVFRFFLHSIASRWFIRTLPVHAWFIQFYLLPSPSGQPPGQVQPFGPRGGGSCPGGRGLEQIKNIFSLILRSMCHFSRGLHDGYGPQDYVFLRKNAGICRRVVGEE